MTENAWEAFSALRDEFRTFCETLSAEHPELREAEQALVDGREEAGYTVETPVLYNYRMDSFDRESSIRLILVADNPGRREQAAENRRYLVGPSGKIAARFFRENPELETDFDANVLILNKTPVHTPRTALLRDLGSAAVTVSQRFMAEILRRFHEALEVPVWITGYSEMNSRGIFAGYTRALTAAYSAAPGLRENLFVFRHFSMNQFTADLKKKRQPGESLPSALRRIGSDYRKHILGW